MPAGTNCKIRVWRLNYLDDEVGGAYPSGTVLHENLDARIEEELTETSFIQQGLEAVKVFSGMIWGIILWCGSRTKLRLSPLRTIFTLENTLGLRMVGMIVGIHPSNKTIYL